MQWQTIYQAACDAQATGAVQPKYSSNERRERARAFYERELKEQFEAEREGAFAVINGDTLEYEVDDNDVTASLRMLERNPACGPLLVHIRVGHIATYRIGLVPRQVAQ